MVTLSRACKTNGKSGLGEAAGGKRVREAAFVPLLRFADVVGDGGYSYRYYRAGNTAPPPDHPRWSGGAAPVRRLDDGGLFYGELLRSELASPFAAPVTVAAREPGTRTGRLGA